MIFFAIGPVNRSDAGHTMLMGLCLQCTKRPVTLQPVAELIIMELALSFVPCAIWGWHTNMRSATERPGHQAPVKRSGTAREEDRSDGVQACTGQSDRAETGRALLCGSPISAEFVKACRAFGSTELEGARQSHDPHDWFSRLR